MEPTIYCECPNCKGQAYSEGVNVGVGYMYPPFHCDCGWSDRCHLWNTENCSKKCTEYDVCSQEPNKINDLS